MQISAELNSLGMAPRKVRLVADAIRGKSLPEAERILSALGRHAAGPIEKLLRSAVANARQNYQVSAPEELRIARITVDGGPILKRITPRAMGRAFPIRKRTSHVKIMLSGDITARTRVAQARPEIIRGDEGAGSRAGAAEPRRKGAGERDRRPAAARSVDFVRRMFRRKAI